MAQYHTSSNGAVDPKKPGPQTDHTPPTTAARTMQKMPPFTPTNLQPMKPISPRKPQNLDDIPSVKAYIDAKDKQAGR